MPSTSTLPYRAHQLVAWDEAQKIYQESEVAAFRHFSKVASTLSAQVLRACLLATVGYVQEMRKKVGDHHIQTIKGVGYRV
jgi:hypothetical protein